MVTQLCEYTINYWIVKGCVWSWVWLFMPISSTLRKLRQWGWWNWVQSWHGLHSEILSKKRQCGNLNTDVWNVNTFTCYKECTGSEVKDFLNLLDGRKLCQLHFQSVLLFYFHLAFLFHHHSLCSLRVAGVDTEMSQDLFREEDGSIAAYPTKTT